MKFTTKFSTGLFALTSSLSYNINAAVIINEIDYDQPGSDTAEFIELYNSGTSAISLDNYSIDLINGTNASSYLNIDLSGFDIAANSYFVLCDDGGLVENCDYSFTTSSSWFQNGAPDAIGLYNDSGLLDSLSYEGTLALYTEGSVLTISDDGSETSSIARILNGMDSDNNALDFQQGCITPGSVNIAGSGDCSVIAVSTVPVPAAAWLFGSGIIGLTSLARRKRK